MEPHKTRQCIKETPSPHLPQEIIEEILVRLSVKSLLRLKCVSKPWRALISSNGFIKAHLEKSSNDKSFEHHRIILENSIIRANQCFLPSFSHEPLATAVHVDYTPCGSNYGPWFIIDSCNGVVCMCTDETAEDFILWNPSTRKFKQLPPIVMDYNEGGDHFVLMAFGFGFDESNDDYKVVYMFGEIYGEPKGLVKVYSLKTESWRKIGVSTFDSYFEGRGTYASGKLHWDRYDGLEQGIVSFDLENETFGTVEWPDGVDGCFLVNATIDGRLCCVSPSDSKPDDHADYWLLKEYGVKDSWHNFATLERPLYDPPPSGGESRYGHYIPSFVGAHGDILFWFGEDEFHNVLFLMKDGRLGSRVHGLYPRLRPVVYFESLVEL